MTPETISAQLEAGPGPLSLRQAAYAWSDLSATVERCAYDVHRLTLDSAQWWRGDSAERARAHLTAYAEYLHSTADHCRRAAQGCRQAAQAADVARRGVVPLASVLANRAELTRLASTPDPFGVNLPVIALLQFEYAEMDAQDQSVIQSYAAQSAAAVGLLSNSAAAPSSGPGSLADFLKGLLTNGAPNDALGSLGNFLDSNFFNSATNTFASGFAPTGIVQDVTSFGFLTAFLSRSAADAALRETMLFQQPSWLSLLLSRMEAVEREVADGLRVAASADSAERVGRLSVPPSWGRPVAPPVAPPVATLPAVAAASAGETVGFPMLPFVPVAPSAAQARGRGGRRPREDPEYGDPPVVMRRHPLGG